MRNVWRVGPMAAASGFVITATCLGQVARLVPLPAPAEMPVAVPLGINGAGTKIAGYVRSLMTSASRGATWSLSPLTGEWVSDPAPSDPLPFELVDEPSAQACAAVQTYFGIASLSTQATALGGAICTTGFASTADWTDAAPVLRSNLMRIGPDLGLLASGSSLAGAALASVDGADAVGVTGASGDGRVVAGVINRQGTLTAAVWRDNGPWVEVAGLSDDPRAARSLAIGVSADGSTIVGRMLMFDGSSKTPVEHAMRVGADGVALDLGSFGLGLHSSAADASADGRVIVGSADGGSSASGRSAAIWSDGATTPDDLLLRLRDQGAYVSSWLLIEAAGVSDNGTVVIGMGLDDSGTPAGYVAELVPQLHADFNRDGVVGIADLDDFLSVYFADPPVPGPGGFARACPDLPWPYSEGFFAAVNGGCEVTPDDLGDFLTMYFEGR